MPTDQISIDCLDLTLPSPVANLAWEEALLEQRDAHGGAGVLRFWESTVPFIVVGYAARLADEVYLERCDTLGVPVLRRCSGGGTVLQGPGCLNYALILPLDLIGPAATITETNCFVMKRHQAACESLLGQPVVTAGHTDLACNDHKFSGNAQRRKRGWFLFHGTFLLSSFDLDLLPRLLRPPPREPDYRRHRDHLAFVRRLPPAIDSAKIQQALRSAWQARIQSEKWVEPGVAARTQELIVNRYSRLDWNRRQ